MKTLTTIGRVNKQPSLRPVVIENIFGKDSANFLGRRRIVSYNNILLPTRNTVDAALYEVANAIGDATGGHSFR